MLERSGKKGGRLKSAEMLAEQREPEKSYSAQIIELFARQGIENFTLGDGSLVLAVAANPDAYLKLQKNLLAHAKGTVERTSGPNPPISISSLARAKIFDPRITFPKEYPRTATEEVRWIKEKEHQNWLEFGALACVGFAKEQKAIIDFLKNNYPDIFEKIMKEPYAIRGNQHELTSLTMPALARLLGLISEHQVTEFNDKFLSEFKGDFQECVEYLKGPKITDKAWLGRALSMALALEVLEAGRAYITPEGKFVLERKKSLDGLTPPLPERLTA